MNEKENKFNSFLKNLTYGTQYTLLEEAKDSEELKKIAEKNGLTMPSRDLAIFKGRYAFVDKENKNGCTLPKEEIEKSLSTLKGKAVDLDHYRKRTVGYWLDDYLDGDEIITYAAFWKSNFSEEYDDIKNLFEKGKLKISFEAWGDRVYKSEGSYDLTNIELAGGALLLNTSPAFNDAEVLELSSKKQFLELAKDMSEPPTFVRDRKDVEASKFALWDVPMISRLISEIKKCPSCQIDNPYLDMLNFDFENDKGQVQCAKCGAKLNLNLMPDVTVHKKGKKIKDISVASINYEDFDGSDEELEVVLSNLLEGDSLIDEDNKTIEEAKKISYKERKAIDDKMFAVLVTVKNKKTGDPRKIRMFPIHDPAHVRNALARLPQATQTLEKLGVSVDSVRKKILKRAKELNMTDLLKRHKEGASELMDELLKKYGKTSVDDLAKFLDVELSTLKTSLEAVNKELATLKTDSEASKKLMDEAKIKIEAAKTKETELTATITTLTAEVEVSRKEKKDRETAEISAKLKERKDKLGDSAKDMKDEDILIDMKYENAMLKKILKEKAPEIASENIIELGAKRSANTDTAFDLQEKVRKEAFGE